MKIDESGGASANDRLEERLASRFATELDRAERDYPVLRLRPRGAAESGRRRRVWPRLVAVPVGIAAILLVAIVGSPWLIPGAAPVAPAPGSSGVSPGSDGIPTQIDGQRVYRAADQASFASLSGSFLLGGPFTKPEFVPPCPMPVDKSAAEQQLIPYCYLRTIDGLQVAPESDIDEPNDEPVVDTGHDRLDFVELAGRLHIGLAGEAFGIGVVEGQAVKREVVGPQAESGPERGLHQFQDSKCRVAVRLHPEAEVLKKLAMKDGVALSALQARSPGATVR